MTLACLAFFFFSPSSLPVNYVPTKTYWLQLYNMKRWNFEVLEWILNTLYVRLRADMPIPAYWQNGLLLQNHNLNVATSQRLGFFCVLYQAVWSWVIFTQGNWKNERDVLKFISNKVWKTVLEDVSFQYSSFASALMKSDLIHSMFSLFRLRLIFVS